MTTKTNTELAQSTGEGKDTMDAIKSAQGTYKDRVDESTDVESKLPFAQLPKGKDPDPFTLGPTQPSGQRE